MKKSILLIFAILAIIFIQLPQIYAKEITEITFEETDTVQISTLEELEAFRDDVNGGNTYEDKTVELTADIDMSEKYSAGEENWISIGTSEHPFNGTFDGYGHTINVYITGGGNGLFGYTENDAVISGLNVSGSLTIEGVFSLRPPSSSTSPIYGGAIVEYNKGSITNCSNTADIVFYGNYGSIGGIAGISEGTITNCYNAGDVEFGVNIANTASTDLIENCFYLAEYESQDESGAYGKTAEQFASGEITYLLNGGRSDGAWYQTIGRDAFPVLDSTHSAVYFDGESYYNEINAEISMYLLSDEDYGTPFTFTTYEELEAYIDQNDLGEYNSNRLLEMYPREFFDYKFLYVRYADGGSGSNLYDVQTSESENDIEIVITRTQEGMTDDYMEYCLYAELDKSLLGKDINVVSENITSNYNYYIGKVQTQNEFIPEDKLKLDYTIVNSNDELNSVWNGDANLKTAYGTEFFRNKSLLIVSWEQENTERNYEVASVVLSDTGSEVTLSYFVPDGTSAVGTESYSAVIAIPKTYSDTRVTITAVGDEKEYPYEITSIRLTDTAGEVIAGPNIGQSFIVETGISKLRERNEQDYLFVVVYDEDGSLMNIDYVKANFTIGGEYAFGFNVPPQNKKIGYVKAFVWNTFNSMEPLAATEIYTPVVFE